MEIIPITSARTFQSTCLFGGCGSFTAGSLFMSMWPLIGLLGQIRSDHMRIVFQISATSQEIWLPVLSLSPTYDIWKIIKLLNPPFCFNKNIYNKLGCKNLSNLRPVDGDIYNKLFLLFCPGCFLVKDPGSGPWCSLNPRSSPSFIINMFVRFVSGSSGSSSPGGGSWVLLQLKKTWKLTWMKVPAVEMCKLSVVSCRLLLFYYLFLWIRMMWDVMTDLFPGIYFFLLSAKQMTEA